jgi:dihydrofolate reductase
MITLIVARARDGAIGRDGTIPWQVPEDLKFFQRETLGGALIMGRATWESLPVKPLSGRLNIVVSSNPQLAEGVVPSVKAATELARAQGYQRLYGIGGARIYAEMLPLADRLLISEVDIAVEAADTFFPRFAPQDWERIGTRPLRLAQPATTVHEYLRRR